MPSLAEIHRSLSISPRPTNRQKIVTSENFTSEANEFGLYNFTRFRLVKRIWNEFETRENHVFSDPNILSRLSDRTRLAWIRIIYRNTHARVPSTRKQSNNKIESYFSRRPTYRLLPPQASITPLSPTRSGHAPRFLLLFLLLFSARVAAAWLPTHSVTGNNNNRERYDDFTERVQIHGNELMRGDLSYLILGKIGPIKGGYKTWNKNVSPSDKQLSVCSIEK